MSTETKPTEKKPSEASGSVKRLFRELFLLFTAWSRERIQSVTGREWTFIAIGAACTFFASILFYNWGESTGRARGDVETIIKVVTTNDKGIQKTREFKPVIE